jgi:hypothetical protein
MVAAPFLPTNPADLDLDGQNNDNSQQEPAMGPNHGCSPGLAASRPLLGAVAVLGPAPCRRTGKSPALKVTKPPAVKFKLLPQKQARILWAYRSDLALGYLEATLLDANCRPADPAAFQTAIDSVAKLIKLNRWQDPEAKRINQWKRQCGIAA